jgi:hypothetical protein
MVVENIIKSHSINLICARFFQDKVGEEVLAAECNDSDEQAWNFDESSV